MCPQSTKAEAAPVPVDADVTEGDEALQIDQVLHHLGVGQRDDLLGLGQSAGWRFAHEVGQGVEDMALGGRPQKGRGNALAHHVRDDDVQDAVVVLIEVVEIAVDLPGGDGERRQPEAGDVDRQRVEQQRLLDVVADLDFAVANRLGFDRAIFARPASQPDHAERQVAGQFGQQA